MYVVFQNTPEVCNFSIDLTKSSSVFLIDDFTVQKYNIGKQGDDFCE